MKTSLSVCFFVMMFALVSINVGPEADKPFWFALFYAMVVGFWMFKFEIEKEGNEK